MKQRDWLWRLCNALYELQYFTHLVEEHEIKDKFALDHYSPDIRRVLFLGEETAFHFGKRLGPNQRIVNHVNRTAS
jgi:hypothetical protein